MRPRSVLLTSTRFGMFRKKYQKSSKNLAETCPKSKKNQRKIEKNENKSMEKATMSEESEKCAKHAKKMRKVTQHGSKNPSLDGIRETLSLLRKELKPSVTYENPFK